MMRIVRRSCREGGVGLIEILVALLVLSIGVLGFAGLQLRALDSTDGAYQRSQAMAIADDAVERIMANQGSKSVYTTEANWNVTPAASLPQSCVNSDCYASAIASWDIAQLVWYANDLLPQGVVRVEDCEDGSVQQCVLVAWNGESLDDCQDANGAVEGLDCVVLEVHL